MSHCDFAYQADGRVLFALSEGLTNKPIKMIDVALKKRSPFQFHHTDEYIIQVEGIVLLYCL